MLIQTWLHDKAQGTQDGYRHDVLSLLEMLQGPRTLTLPQIQAWTETLKHPVPATQGCKIAAIKSSGALPDARRWSGASSVDIALEMQ